MELSDAVRLRHMTRNFSGRVPDPGVIDQLLDGAIRAPSAGNTQGREFVVLSGPSQTVRYWEATTDREWRERSPRFDGLSRAPVVVLPFADPDAYARRYREPDKSGRGGDDRPDVRWIVPFWYVDIAFSVMTILLGSTDVGLGASFLGNFRGEGALKAELGVPDRLRWVGAVLLGEAAKPDHRSASLDRPRRIVGDSVHRGGW